MKKFSLCHPYVNYFFYISAVIFGVIFRHPVLLCISFLSVLAYYIKCMERRGLRNLFAFYCPMILFVTLINGLTAHYGVTPLFSLPSGNKVCLEPILYGFVTGVSAVSVMMLFSCYNKTVTSEKLLFVLGSRFPKTAMLLTLSLRFVPVYGEKLREIADAQQGMRLGINNGKLFDRAKNAFRIFGILLSWVLENAIVTADSMKSRGYGLKNRSHYSVFHFSHFDAFLLTLFIVCDCVIIAGAAVGAAEVVYNPFFKINAITLFSFVMYFSYLLLLLTPFIVDSSEDLKWKKSESKI